MDKLLCFVPCSKRKVASGRTAGAITTVSAVNLPLTQLDAGRAQMKHCIRPDSPPTAALELYTGHFFSVSGVKETSRAMIDSGDLDLFILSAGYGVIHALETVHDYEAKMIGEVAALWQQYGLADVIANICLALCPSEVFGFFSGTPDWSRVNSMYRHFFTGGVHQAVAAGLRPERAGCFYRRSGRGVSAIVQGLAGVFLDVLVSKDRESLVEEARSEGIRRNGVVVGYHDLTHGLSPEGFLVNTPRDSERTSTISPGKISDVAPQSEDFQREIDRILSSELGRAVEIEARDLHRAVGGYPGRDHRMPTCCHVMYRGMQPGDEVINQPRKGVGANLRIRYYRPVKPETDESEGGEPSDRSAGQVTAAPSGHCPAGMADVARALFEAFTYGSGIFGRKAEDMPEAGHMRHVDSYARVNVITVTVMMDYQTNSDVLWAAALATYRDPETRWVFDMDQVAKRPVEMLENALSKHGFTGMSRSGNAGYVRRVCSTFARRYGGDPHGLLAAHGYDAMSLHSQRRTLGDLPYLTGNKIFPLWLRILSDVAKVKLKDLDRVPLPVDVHTARATYRLISRDSHEGNRAFRAGDGSGFYIWHAAGHFFYFHDLEAGEASRIDCPAFRHADDLSRMVTVVGSPVATRDVIMFEHHRDWDTDSHRWRLTVVDPDRREHLCLAEFDDTFSWVEGVASHTAILTRAGVQGIRELDRCGRLWQLIDDVRLYRLGADGQWTSASYTDRIRPALRVDRLTQVTFMDDVPWIVEVAPDGSVEPLFILSEQALHMAADPVWSWWDSSGRCMFIMQADSVIRYVGE